MVSLNSFMKMSMDKKVRTFKKEQYNLNKRIKRIRNAPETVLFAVKKYDSLFADLKGIGTKKLMNAIIADNTGVDIDTLYKKLFTLGNSDSSYVKGAKAINKKMSETMGEDLYKKLGNRENRAKWWDAFTRLKNKLKATDSDFDSHQVLTLMRDIADPDDGEITYKIVDSDVTDSTGQPLPEFKFYRNGEEISDEGIGAIISDNRMTLNSMKYMHDNGVVFKSGKGYTKNPKWENMVSEFSDRVQRDIKKSSNKLVRNTRKRIKKTVKNIKKDIKKKIKDFKKSTKKSTKK